MHSPPGNEIYHRSPYPYSGTENFEMDPVMQESVKGNLHYSTPVPNVTISAEEREKLSAPKHPTDSRWQPSMPNRDVRGVGATPLQCALCQKRFADKGGRERHWNFSCPHNEDKLNATCPLAGCPSATAKKCTEECTSSLHIGCIRTFRVYDKIREHLSTKHGWTEEERMHLPKAWFWPLAQNRRGAFPIWACKLCRANLGTWEANHEQMTAHMNVCPKAASALQARATFLKNLD
jgi:hypothetical protein